MLFSVNFYAQVKLKGTLINSNTGLPLRYVNVGIVSKDIGTVTNQYGEFNLEVENQYLNDSITLSMIGFSTQKLPIEYFVLKDSVFLDQKFINIKDLIVNNKKGQEIFLGNERPDFMYATVSLKLIEAGNEIGIFVDVDKQTEIYKFNLLIVKSDYDRLKFRINFYDLKDKIPNKRINSENIIVETTIKEGLISFDLKDYAIYMKENFFVSIESLEELWDDNKEIIVVGKIGGKSYSRLTSQSDWITYKLGVCIFLNAIEY